MEREITKKQKEVLDYIKKYVASHGYPPAIREIGAGLGLSSPATVFTHLKKLGFINRYFICFASYIFFKLLFIFRTALKPSSSMLSNI